LAMSSKTHFNFRRLHSEQLRISRRYETGFFLAFRTVVTCVIVKPGSSRMLWLTTAFIAIEAYSVVY
jgi:hypothetical protein